MAGKFQSNSKVGYQSASPLPFTSLIRVMPCTMHTLKIGVKLKPEFGHIFQPCQGFELPTYRLKVPKLNHQRRKPDMHM